MKTIEAKLVDSEGNMFCPLHVCLDSYRDGEAISDGDVLRVETHHQAVTFKYENGNFIELSAELKEEFGL